MSEATSPAPAAQQMGVGHLAGMRVVESPHLMVPGGEREVRRSWSERLFARPWRPWRATRRVPVSKPDPNVYRIQGMLVGHPATLAALYAQVQQ
jgi:hypothetical protein